MKYAKANSFHTQLAIARYGKSARHPLCLAALSLWRLDEEVSRWIKEVVRAEELVSSTKQLRERAQMDIKQFRKERREKEANEVSALSREIDKLLLRAQARYQNVVKICLLYHELRQHPRAQFKRKYDAAIRTGDVRPLRALQRVRKRLNDKKAFIGDTDRRTLEMLNMLNEEVRKAALEKGGAKAGLMEAALGGSRPLSDEALQGLLTAREIQSRLVDAPVDRDAKEVRRLASKLGIRLAEDQRGRKRNPYLSKQEPNRPRGRPRTKPDIGFTNDLEAKEAMKVGAATGKTPRACGCLLGCTLAPLCTYRPWLDSRYPPCKSAILILKPRAPKASPEATRGFFRGVKC